MVCRDRAVSMSHPSLGVPCAYGSLGRVLGHHPSQREHIDKGLLVHILYRGVCPPAAKLYARLSGVSGSVEEDDVLEKSERCVCVVDWLSFERRFFK
jgi:hypothetical protein